MTAEPIPAPSTSRDPIVLQLSQRPAPYPPQVQQDLRAQARTIVDRYPRSRSALLPLLHLVQSVEGYVSGTGIAFCAEQLGLTDAEVTAVATFYSMYRRTPTGEYHLGVCTNTLCAVLGGDEILAELGRHLELAPGETTSDGAITLEHLECNAACDYAPVVMVNWEFFDNQTPESARALADDLRAGRAVTGTRSGAPLCGFRETARVLAGFPDTRADANAGEPGAPTLAGLRAARGREPELGARNTEDSPRDTGEGDRQ